MSQPRGSIRFSQVRPPSDDGSGDDSGTAQSPFSSLGGASTSTAGRRRNTTGASPPPGTAARPRVDTGSTVLPARLRAGTTSIPSLSGVIPPGVAPDELGTLQERDKNRAMLKELYDRFRTQERDWKQFSEATQNSLQQMMQTHKQELAKMEQATAQNITKLRTEKEQLKQQSEGAHRSMEQLMKRQEQATKEKIEKLSRQNDELKQQSELLSKSNKQLKQDLKKESDNNLAELRKLTKDSKAPVEAMMHFERKSNKLEADVRELRAQIARGGQVQSGVVMQTIVNNFTPEEIAQHPPVGNIELGEDVFTARLMLRLGIMKGRHDKKREMAEQLAELDDCSEQRNAVEDSQKHGSKKDVRALCLLEAEEESYKMLAVTGELHDGSESTHSGSDHAKYPSTDSDSEQHQYNKQADENVSGISVPDVERGTPGFWKVTVGWCAVCLVTAAIQLLSLTVTLLNALNSEECFEHKLKPMDWWLLHLSKGAAMLVAATLMGSSLMEVVNYIMIAELMLHRRSKEVIVTAFMRIAVSFSIVGANIAVFRQLTNPADVWMNMTAFAFISAIDKDVFEVAKRGVFGNDIQRATTEMNFNLCFMTLYPPWFHSVRMLVLGIAGIAVVIFCVVTFYLPDPMCPHHGKG